MARGEEEFGRDDEEVLNLLGSETLAEQSELEHSAYQCGYKIAQLDERRDKPS